MEGLYPRSQTWGELPGFQWGSRPEAWCSFSPSGPEEDLCLHEVQPLPPRPSVPEACRVGQQVVPTTRRWAWGASALETRWTFLPAEPSVFFFFLLFTLDGFLAPLSPSHTPFHPYFKDSVSHYFWAKFLPTPHDPFCIKATQTVLPFHDYFCCEQPSQAPGPQGSALSSQCCPEDQTWPGVQSMLPSVIPAQPDWCPIKP